MDTNGTGTVTPLLSGSEPPVGSPSAPPLALLRHTSSLQDMSEQNGNGDFLSPFPAQGSVASSERGVPASGSASSRASISSASDTGSRSSRLVDMGAGAGAAASSGVSPRSGAGDTEMMGTEVTPFVNSTSLLEEKTIGETTTYTPNMNAIGAVGMYQTTLAIDGMHDFSDKSRSSLNKNTVYDHLFGSRFNGINSKKISSFDKIYKQTADKEKKKMIKSIDPDTLHHLVSQDQRGDRDSEVTCNLSGRPDTSFTYNLFPINKIDITKDGVVGKDQTINKIYIERSKLKNEEIIGRIQNILEIEEGGSARYTFDAPKIPKAVYERVFDPSKYSEGSQIISDAIDPATITNENLVDIDGKTIIYKIPTIINEKGIMYFNYTPISRNEYAFRVSSGTRENIEISRSEEYKINTGGIAPSVTDISDYINARSGNKNRKLFSCLKKILRFKIQRKQSSQFDGLLESIEGIIRGELAKPGNIASSGGAGAGAVAVRERTNNIVYSALMALKTCGDQSRIYDTFAIEKLKGDKTYLVTLDTFLKDIAYLHNSVNMIHDNLVRPNLTSIKKKYLMEVFKIATNEEASKERSVRKAEDIDGLMGDINKITNVSDAIINAYKLGFINAEEKVEGSGRRSKKTFDVSLNGSVENYSEQNYLFLYLSIIVVFLQEIHRRQLQKIAGHILGISNSDEKNTLFEDIERDCGRIYGLYERLTSADYSNYIGSTEFKKFVTDNTELKNFIDNVKYKTSIISDIEYYIRTIKKVNKGFNPIPGTYNLDKNEIKFLDQCAAFVHVVPKNFNTILSNNVFQLVEIITSLSGDGAGAGAGAGVGAGRGAIETEELGGKGEAMVGGGFSAISDPSAVVGIVSNIVKNIFKDISGGDISDIELFDAHDMIQYLCSIGIEYNGSLNAILYGGDKAFDMLALGDVDLIRFGINVETVLLNEGEDVTNVAIPEEITTEDTESVGSGETANEFIGVYSPERGSQAGSVASLGRTQTVASYATADQSQQLTDYALPLWASPLPDKKAGEKRSRKYGTDNTDGEYNIKRRAGTTKGNAGAAAGVGEGEGEDLSMEGGKRRTTRKRIKKKQSKKMTRKSKTKKRKSKHTTKRKSRNTTRKRKQKTRRHRSQPRKKQAQKK